MAYVSPEDWTPTPGIVVDGIAREILSADKSISVLAGPGSGKTELLAQRAAFLLNTGQCRAPQRILAIAFKVDAARNLQERVEQRCDELSARRFESLTIHGFAKRILDQFLEALPEHVRPTSDYDILFPNSDTWSDFTQRNGEVVPDVLSLNSKQLNKLVHRRIPDFSVESDSTQDQISRLWWHQNINDKTTSTLTFDMVLLLATRIVQSQANVLEALRQTYSHVFLDEFQDVNTPQYNLIKAIFHESPSVLTAVGDTKQAIMQFAGALPDVFVRFNDDFNAETSRLLLNYRSNLDIVKLINSLAHLFEDNPVMTEAARKDDPVPDVPVEAWIFEENRLEEEYLASFVKDALDAEDTLKPEDFVILARLRVNDVEARLKQNFSNKHIPLRNEARTVSSIAIQDLMKEPIFRFVISALKMAVGVRLGTPFQDFRNILADLQGYDITTDKGNADSLREIQLITSNLKALLDADRDAVAGKDITDLLVPDKRVLQFSRCFNAYNNKKYRENVVKAVAGYFDECLAATTDWKHCIDNLEGRGAVKLMTIHKSKGLEYNTVIFTEFNDSAFWGNAEDVNVFFVALSRARERVRFSFSKEQNTFDNIENLTAALSKGGVQFVTRP